MKITGTRAADRFAGAVVSAIVIGTETSSGTQYDRRTPAHEPNADRDDPRTAVVQHRTDAVSDRRDVPRRLQVQCRNLRQPFALPQAFTLKNFETIWRETNFPRYLANSLIVTLSSVVCILATATCAAYAIARYKFRGNALFYLFFLSGLVVPLKLAIIPLFIQLRTLELIDSHPALCSSTPPWGCRARSSS